MPTKCYKVEFYFDDEDTGVFLSSQIDFIFAGDYDLALEQARKMQDELGAQDFCFED